MKNILTLLFIGCMLLNITNAQELKPHAYKDGDQKLNGLIIESSNSNKKAVLILPAWKGIDNESKDAAIALHKEGYIAFVADIYGEGNIPADNAAASKIAGQYKTDYKAYQNRIQLAINELKKMGAEKIAVIGYCFGGTGALETARAGFDVSGIVCIHGGLAKASDRANGPIKTKVLVEHPDADEGVSKADYDGLIKELNEGNADWQIITYADAKHTFTNPESKDYNETMAKRAWNHTLMFLKEVLN